MRISGFAMQKMHFYRNFYFIAERCNNHLLTWFSYKNNPFQKNAIIRYNHVFFCVGEYILDQNNNFFALNSCVSFHIVV